MKRDDLLLALGMAAGAALAIHRPAPPLPADAVARVDDRLITVADYRRAIAGLDAAQDPAIARRVIDRLIDEALLVQHGLDSGLAARDPTLRAQLAALVIESLDAPEPPADEPSLRRFYEADPARFAPPPAARVRHAVADSREALFHAPFDPTLPDALLPASKLVDYLGPRLARAALESTDLEVGPLEHEGRFHRLRVEERRASVPPPFEAIAEQVGAAHARARADHRLRSFLDEARASARIAVRGPP